MTAEAALAHGLIVRMCEPGTVPRRGSRVWRPPSRGNAPLGLEAVKRILRLAPGRSEDELWPAQRELVDTVFNSEDAREGARAFAERRPPVWTGR